MVDKLKDIEFNKENWLLNREKRYTMISSIINKKLAIGLTKEEIIDFLGFEFNDIHSNIWTYFIGKRFFFSTKKKLFIYFNDAGKVYKLTKK